MWDTLLIGLAVIVAVVVAFVVLERMEFLSVFPRLRRRRRDGSDGPPAP